LLDIVSHGGHFCFVVKEIASAWANQYVHFQSFNLAHRPHESCRGRYAAYFKRCAKFYARCATLLCG
jgi:hypothetical protein